MSDSNESLTDDTDDTMGSGASTDGGASQQKDASQSRQQMSARAGSSQGLPASSQVLPARQPSLRRQGSSAISRQLTRSSSNAASLRSGDHASRASINYSTSQNKFIDGYERPIVSVTKAGFSIQNITIMEGQMVTFTWEEQTTEILNVVQVVHDGEKLRPVIGGFCLEPESLREKEQKFNMEGEFKFVLAGLRCTPLNVSVRPRLELQAEVADTGFSPEYVEIDQFHSVKWQWKQTAVPHSVQAVSYCMKHGGFYKESANSGSVVGTMSGSYRHMFLQPGLYYFQTEAMDLGRHHLCIVYVKESQREQKIEVLDRSFQPMILLIEEGDRVWWSWDKYKCKKPHSVYQMAAPTIGHNPDDPYEAVKDGFKWSTPSKQGLMSHEFFKPGVYFFSDQNFQEAAEYIGTIIVKPRQKVQDIEITQNGFVPDVLYAQTGDRLWWAWNPDIADTSDSFSIIEVEKCLNPVARKSELTDCEDQCQLMDDATTRTCVKIGLATAFYPTIGVYQYKLMNSTGILSSCAVLINPGPKNYTVHITDNGFEPKVITVRPNDRVWWVWQSGRKQHNVTQVSHQGLPIEDGFSSGAVRDCPSAFMNEFFSCGVFYFMSASLPKIFGAVVVSTQPSVHEVNVSATEIQPDPIVVNVNDIVCWMYKGLRSFDVSQLTAIDQVLQPDFGCNAISPRRCVSRIVSQAGLLHYYSKSFQKSKDKNSQETRLSSIVSDNRYDNEVIRVSKSGFYPPSLHVQKGQTVLWTWKEAGDEEHNIIHVKPSQGEEPLEIIQGAKSFNSGKTVSKNSFLYTFDEVGQFTIASQGAPGYRSIVSVVSFASRSLQPYISSELTGGTVDRHTQVQLSCDLPDALIYYTVDGSIPHLHSTSVKLYQPEKGVILKKSGLVIIRAMSVAKEQLHSHVYTSKRFWVLSKDDESSEEDGESTVNPDDVASMQPDSSTSWKWWNCVPTVRGCFTSSGRMEVFWDPPADDAISLIQGYQLYLNGVCYCEMFPTTNNSVSVSSLAGGRLYEVEVAVFPLNAKYAPLRSNKLLMKCPLVTSENGPIISLERTEEKDSIAIVWMAISTPALPVVGYLLFLNDQQCGQRLVPDAESNRCKVVIDGCDMSNSYKIYVVALPKDTSEEPTMSNILQVRLPLDSSQICLPPPDQRLDDDELYQEHLEIHEGSGYLPEMDENPQLSADDAKRRASVTFQTVIKDAGPKDDQHRDGLAHKSGKHFPHALVEVEQETGTKDQSFITGDNERSTHSRRNQIMKQAKMQQRSLYKANQKAAMDEDSDSEVSDSSWDSESDSEGPDYVVIDARHPAESSRAKKARRNTGRRDHKRPHDRLIVEVDNSSSTQKGMEQRIARHHGRRRKSRGCAIIEVQETVELDLQKLPGQSGDLDTPIRKMLSVPAKSSMVRVDEGQFIQSDGEGILPAPSVMIENRGANRIKVQWELPRKPDPDYNLLMYVVNVVGVRFLADVNSDLSFECNIVEKEEQTRGVQHCWNISGRECCQVHGLVSGLTYRVYVIANYTLLHGEQPCEIQTSSSVMYYTTVEPPKPPKLKVTSVDLFQACAEWDIPELHGNVQLKGFQIFIDGKPLGGLRNNRVLQMMINHMIPGKTVSVSVAAVTKQAIADSEPSKSVHLTCPARPPAPVVYQQPSYKRGCLLIGWERPQGHSYSSNEEDISLYSIFMDGKWYGEVRSNPSHNKHGYQFFLTDLPSGQSIDINVKAVAGSKRIYPSSHHVYALSDSPWSNTLSLMAPASPTSPLLRLDGLHPDGIDVTWQAPQQFGDVTLSGYQLLKNGKLYGSIIPPDVCSLRIKDITLGEKLKLQLIALTDHPVGKGDHRAVEDKDSGIDGSSQHDDKDCFASDKYGGCKPGAQLAVHYTGLVQPPSQVWAEKVTGHSALVVWNKDLQPKAHFVRPTSYQVTWWPGDKPKDSINSDSTTGDHLWISNLHPATTYTVTVEARKMEKYMDFDEDSMETDADNFSAFILTSQSEQLTLQTASPPEAPRNIGVLGTTCSSLRLGWDHPQEHGVEVTGLRVDCKPVESHVAQRIRLDLMPDATSAIIENLEERTEYVIHITAVTDEYFDHLTDNHKLRKIRSLPKEMSVIPEDSVWLPTATVLAKTSGTDPPANLHILAATTGALTLSWTPPVVHGSNKLLGVVVRWSDLKQAKSKEDDFVVARHVNLLPREDTLTLKDLLPGTQYKIVAEAVVSVKSSLDEEKWNSGIAKNRRTTHVMSSPLVARTKAPCEAPRPLLTSFTQNTASLYWEKPLLVSVVGRDEDGQPKYLRRYLEGYKLEINGKLHCALGPSEQSCTLTKCKSGKPYQVDLVALTCTDDMRKERKGNQLKPAYKRSHPQTSQDYTLILGDDDTLDSSPSDSADIHLPKKQEGYLASLSGRFEYDDNRDNQTLGDIIIDWTIQGNSNLLRQFNIIWYCHEDKVVQTKYVGSDQRKCTIPVSRNKAVYEVTVEPTYNTAVISQSPQSVQILVPGPPDAPQIFLHSVEPEEFIIEWGEPRLYAGVQIKAYQLYMNEKKAGNELSSSHRKAVIPCRPNRQYTVSLVALSCSSGVADSPMSNTLRVNTASTSPRLEGAFGLEEWAALTDDQEIPLKVTMVTGSAIHLDWSAFLGTSEIACYRVQWSSVAQPTQREVRVSSQDSNCVISRCLPGTTHFVRLVAVDRMGEILERSKQLTVQTSAPPDSPILSVRASNFRYIAIQWEKPNQYGDCPVTGYKVFVNDIVEAILNADQLSFTFTHGKWCQEYSFQVQALCGTDGMLSQPSDALLVTWPGVLAPLVRRVPTVSGSVLRLGWDEPAHTDSVTIKHYRLCCYEEGTEKLVQSVGPIHPETHEAEFRNLSKGNYVVFLEVYIYGTSDVVRSDPLRMQPAIAPEPPHISATVVGLEDRRLIEKITCELVNKRDRLIRKVGHKIKKIGALNYPMRAEKDEEILHGAMMLSNVDEMLEECFTALSQHTGQLLVHVSWQSIQSNPDICVSGFQALVNGKQYGNAVHPGIKHIRLKLNLEESSHKLAMVATSEKPQAVSEESNVVELLTEPFQPFSFYCYHSIHSKDTQWPSHGCCQYQDSIMFERRQAKKLANQGLLKKRVPPPACSLLDVFDGEYKPLDWKYKKNLPTALFFWTPWCLASKKMMNNFIRFARESSREHAFIAITCGMKGTALADRQQLIHTITEHGWREDGVVWHCTSQCASSITEATNNIRRSAVGRHSRLSADAGYDSQMDLTELLGIAGVPTFLFLREDGCIAWHGRYCAYDYNSFASFMRHSFSDVLDFPCTVYNCDCCKNDMEINRDALDELVHITSLNGSTSLLRQSGSAIQVSSDPTYNAIISTPHNAGHRDVYPAHNGGHRDVYPAHNAGHRDVYPTHNAGHRDIYPTHEILVFSRENSPNRKAKKDDKISINIRPFSASPPSSSLTSPYLQRLTPKRTLRRPRSRKAVYF